MHVMVNRQATAARRCICTRAVRLAMRGAVVLLLAIAVLPSVLPYDHLLLPTVSHDDGHEHAHEGPAHAEHCHSTPASCADAPLTSGPGQFLQADALLSAPALTAVLLLLAVPMLAGRTIAPELRPPLQRLAAT